MVTRLSVKGAPSEQTSLLCRVALLVALPLLFLWGLWLGTLGNNDDALFAWAVRNAARGGEWLDYRWHGAQLDFLYPPLHFIALRLSSMLFGTTELALRLPAALATTGTGFLIASIVARTTGSWAGGLVTGLLFAASPHVFDSSRCLRLDAGLMFFCTAAMWSYLRAEERPRWLVVCGLSLGLAALTKGVMVALVLVPIAVDVLTSERRRQRHTLWGLVLFAAVAGSWHIWQLCRYGWRFVDEYVLYSIFQRVGGISGLGRDSSSFFAQTVSFEGAMIAFWAVGMVALILGVRTDRTRRLLLMWAVCGLAPALISSTRLPQYFLLGLPPLFIGCGLLLGRWMHRRWVVVGAIAVSAVLFFASNAGPWLNPNFSAQLPEAATRAATLSPDEPIVVFNDYHAGVDYYADHPTVLLTDSEAAHQMLSAPRTMRDGAVIVHIQPSEMSAALTGRESTTWITTSLFADRLLGYVDRLSSAERSRFHMERFGQYVLLHRSAPSS